jgi:hypothetical protein
VVYAVDHRLLLLSIGGFMAKAEAAAPNISGALTSMKLKAVDALFFLAFGLIAIGLAVGFMLQ